MHKEQRDVMMRFALCDDEKNISLQLKDMLLKLIDDAVVDIYEQGQDLLNTNINYDVLFCDIDMPTMNGIHLGEQIRNQNKQITIIYLTNYSDYRTLAFGVHAFDYLEKPLQMETLKKVILEVQDYRFKNEKVIKKITFHTKEGILHLEVDEIVYFEYENRHLYMQTTQERFCLTQSLQSIYLQMQPYDFKIPHKSFCINLKHVKLLKGYDIHMTNQDIIPLSQKKASQFRSDLVHFLSNCLQDGGVR